jgi:hypothetical protein
MDTALQATHVGPCLPTSPLDLVELGRRFLVLLGRSLGQFVPGDPCPDLLTESEAILYLRLEQIDIDHPEETLRRYRKEGLLRGTQISKRVYYLRSELDAFLRKITEKNPR